MPFSKLVRQEKGFTILELVVVIVIMGILTTLTAANVIKSQITARDHERVDDVNSIAAYFETLYKQGLDSNNGSLSNYNAPLSYPSTLLISSPSSSIASAVFSNLDPKALKSPNSSSGTESNTTTYDLVNSTNNSKATTSTVTPTPSASNDVYVYQPLNIDDTLCTSTTDTFYIRPDPTHCVKFQIFYYDEASQSVEVKTSINQ